MDGPTAGRCWRHGSLPGLWGLPTGIDFTADKGTTPFGIDFSTGIDEGCPPGSVFNTLADTCQRWEDLVCPTGSLVDDGGTMYCSKPIQVVAYLEPGESIDCEFSRDSVPFRVVEGDCPQLDEVASAVFVAFALVDTARRLINLVWQRWHDGDSAGARALWTAGFDDPALAIGSLQYWFGDFEPEENLGIIFLVVEQAWSRIVAGNHLVRCHTYGDNLWYTAGIIHLPENFLTGWDTHLERGRALVHEFCHMLEVLPLVPRDVIRNVCNGENWYSDNICYGEDGALALVDYSADWAAQNIDNYAYWMYNFYELFAGTPQEACPNPWNV